MKVSLAAAAGGKAGRMLRGLRVVCVGERGVEIGWRDRVGGLGFVARAATADADGGGVGGVGF